VSYHACSIHTQISNQAIGDQKSIKKAQTTHKPRKTEEEDGHL